MCHAEGLILAVGGPSESPVVPGPDLSGASFTSVEIQSEGWTAGVFLDYDLVVGLGAGLNDIYTATYTVVDGVLATVEFCDTLGDPLVPRRVLRGSELFLPESESVEVTGVQTFEPGLLLTDGIGTLGENTEVAVLLTNFGEPLEGWQWGVCDDELVSIEMGFIEEGEALDGLDFEFQLITVVDGGWTVAALLEAAAGNVLEAGTGLEMYRATYAVEEVGFSIVSFCETLGDPAVSVRWIVNGAEVEPDTFDAVITVRPERPYLFGVDAPVVTYDPADVAAGIEFSVDLTIREFPTSLGYPNATQAIQMGIAHDGTFIDAVAGEATGVLAAVNGGTGPAFLAIVLERSGGADDGIVLGALYSIVVPVFLEFPVEEPVVTIYYEVIASALASFEGDLDGTSTTLTWSDELGDPDVENSLIVGDVAVEVGRADETVFFTPPGVFTQLLRGDCDGNGTVSALLDALFLLEWSFLNGEDPSCLDAADVDDSGSVSALLDALFLLEWAFHFGEEPPPPGPDRCGPDLPEDDVSCDTPPDACL